MTLSHEAERFFSAEHLALTVFTPSAWRVGGDTATAAVCRFYKARQPLAATMTLATEAFGTSGRLYTDRTEVLSISMPIVATAVDRRQRVLSWLGPLAELLPGRLVLVEALQSTTNEQQRPSAVQQARILVSARCPDRCLTLIDALHAQEVCAAWSCTDVTPRRWREDFHVVPVTVLDESRRLAQVIDAYMAAAYRERTPTGTHASPSGAMETMAIGLGGECVLAHWTKITFTSPEQTHDGASRHRRVVHAMRAAGGPGATTFAASYGYVKPMQPRRPRRFEFGVRRGTPLITTIATDASQLNPCMEILDDLAIVQDLITFEPVLGVRSGRKASRPRRCWW